MFEIKGRRIRLTRGDTAELIVAATGTAFTAEDRAVFTLKREARNREVLVRLPVVPDADGRCVFALQSADTGSLEPGTYWWDVRFVLGAKLDEAGDVTDGTAVVTPFAPQPFEVLEAVGDV